MRASSDLKQFSGLLYPRMLDEHPDLREALADVFQSQKKQQNERLRKTLDQLLSGVISDDELQAIWNDTAPVWNFADNSLRNFLLLARTELEKVLR